MVRQGAVIPNRSLWKTYNLSDMTNSEGAVRQRHFTDFRFTHWLRTFLDLQMTKVFSLSCSTEAAEIVRSISLAVDHLHHLNIAHRDLKVIVH